MSRGVRILYVTQVVLDRPHGGPRHVLAVARAWAERGHALRLLAPGADPELAGMERIRPPRGARPGARLELLQAALTAQAVRAQRPDVAYVRLSATSSAVPLTLAALGVPFVTELNGRILDELAMLGRSPASVAVVGLAQRQVARAAYATVAVEHKISRHARDALGARDVRVVENGADVRMAVPGSRAEARARLGLPLDRPIYAFAGTLAPELRLDLLLEAMRGLAPGILVMAGDGPQSDFLQSELRGREDVRWLGARPHAEAVDLLRAADVCVNVRDGDMGMKALEYAALGRRFVAFEVEGSERLAELYPAGDGAFLVRERSASALVDAIRSALEAERQGPLAEADVARVREEVSWERTAERIEAVLFEAAAGRR